MSKPLELTIYERRGPERRFRGEDGFNYLFEGYDHPEGETTVTLASALAAKKRLTDAELAAEYWAQVHDSQYAMTCELAAEDKPGRKAARHWGAQSTAKATTLHRFATSPHYEADQ